MKKKHTPRFEILWKTQTQSSLSKHIEKETNIDENHNSKAHLKCKHELSSPNIYGCENSSSSETV